MYTIPKCYVLLSKNRSVDNYLRLENYHLQLVDAYQKISDLYYHSTHFVKSIISELFDIVQVKIIYDESNIIQYVEEIKRFSLDEVQSIVIPF